MKHSVSTRDQEARAANRDPISGAPGAHPVGVAVGAATGGAAGAALGVVGGPVGTLLGAGVGAIAGGLTGKAVAEDFDPTVEDAFWREHYVACSYAEPGREYSHYQPAYRFGWEAACRYPGRSFEEIESELADDWERHRGSCTLPWGRASQASRDAWNRVARPEPV